MLSSNAQCCDSGASSLSAVSENISNDKTIRDNFSNNFYTIIASEMGYELEDVPATLVESDRIDRTFRSSCIGRWYLLSGVHNS
jgi:hypothetical protein